MKQLSCYCGRPLKFKWGFLSCDLHKQDTKPRKTRTKQPKKRGYSRNYDGFQRSV